MSHAPLDPDHVAAAQLLWYGHRKLRRHDELEACWKAAKAIAAGDGTLTDDGTDALVGKMTATATPASVIEAVLRWDVHTETPSQLLAHLQVPDDARLELGLWMVYEGLSIGFADGALGYGEAYGVHEVAAAMGVPESTVDALISICHEEALIRLRRVKTLQGRIAIASPRPAPSVEYELIPVTVRGEALRRAR